MIGQLIVRWPQLLALLQVKGFLRDEAEVCDDFLADRQHPDAK